MNVIVNVRAHTNHDIIVSYCFCEFFMHKERAAVINNLHVQLLQLKYTLVYVTMVTSNVTRPFSSRASTVKSINKTELP